MHFWSGKKVQNLDVIQRTTKIFVLSKKHMLQFNISGYVINDCVKIKTWREFITRVFY
jgi:hypothetical protein